MQTPVGYKFKTNAPQRYSVKPVLGVLAPGQSIDVFVRCENWVNPQDRFLLQSAALDEIESQRIDAVTWRELDRRRIIENLIQCSSSSTLSMKDPQDDNGSLSSSSNASTRSLNRSSAHSEKTRQQQQKRSLLLTEQQRLTVAHVHAASRKHMSTTSSPESYSKGGALSRLSTSMTSTQGSSTSYALISALVSYVATKLGDLRQAIKTLSRFLAVRQYTKVQVLAVSVLCLLLGLLLPLENLFLAPNGSFSTTSSSRRK
ncbi:Motile sperm domain-containing protein 2 [Modicella reniformis]|uniref:Motile sperm domain-containing protein 2 n=1 Tax=Modicella reniformis TaxID=1440133 RepID=A0A9P6IMU3_9FUNG|nr:Motile sperm domain-containing protein 2 [Modicella reniformis]